jgi:zinc/manganese transport system substrate-binding protein
MQTHLRIVIWMVLVAGAVVAAGRPAAAQLRVVATTEDLASLTHEVGGDRVKVMAIAKGYQDPHFVDPKPSFILELNRADLLVLVGRELELGWLPTLISSARNAKIQPGATGYLDASADVKILEIPTGQITRAMGDVHPQGNPHYWLDPANGRAMARSIRDRLTQLAPADRAYFAERYDAFDARLTEAEKRWEAMMAPFRGRKLVTYHRSWPNLMERFGLDVVGYVEPKPGIPPSPSHTLTLIGEMKAQGVKVIIVEPYFEKRTPQSIANQVGGQVIELAPSVGGNKEVTDYISLFDFDLSQLVAALKQP